MGDVVKGDERAPKPKKAAKNIYGGMREYLPGIESLITSAIPQYEEAYLNTAQSIAPRMAGLQQFLYNKYGPAAAKVQEKIMNIAAQGDADRLAGPGMQAFRTAEAGAREVDPEFYANRATLGQKFQSLMESPMSEGELESMARGLRKMNVNTGSNEIAGATNTAANAMLFGQGERNRQMQNLGMVSSALPGLRTTTAGDVYGIGNSLGKTYNPNLFARDFNLTEGGAQIGNNLMSNLFGLQGTAMNINANRRTVADQVGQAWQQSGLGQATAMGVGGCYVAREVFGKDSARWIVFRVWLFTEAPKWFKNLYIKYGKSIARFISDKPKLKFAIKFWMERIINA